MQIGLAMVPPTQPRPQPLSLLFPNHYPQPVVGHQRSSSTRRVDSVLGPMCRRSVFDGLVEHDLERDESSVEGIGNTLRGRAIVVKLWEPFFVYRPTPQNEGRFKLKG